jgi:S1-C subfamily serine protease
MLLAALAPAARAGDAEDLRLAERVRAGIVRVEWRSTRGDGLVVRRLAVVVAADGWLLLAGPRPSPAGTLAVLVEEGRRAAAAEVWASDARTCLTLLHVPLDDLTPLPLGRGAPDGAGPAWDALAPVPPDTRVMLVTAEGAVSRGAVRGASRVRRIAHEEGGAAGDVTCLLESGLAAVPTDLGAPWVDERGRVLGLLVGADVTTPPGPDGSDAGPYLRPEVTSAYAVPGAVAAVVWPLLKLHRRVPRAALGALTRPAGPALRQQVCPDCGGHVVEALQPGGPADQGELHLHDVIHALDGVHLAPGIDLADALLPFRPGTRLRLGVLRAGREIERTVVLGTAD